MANLLLRSLRVPIFIEFVNDSVHYLLASKGNINWFDAVSVAISIAVIFSAGWISATRSKLSIPRCGITGAILFVASFLFSALLQAIASHSIRDAAVGIGAMLLFAVTVSPVAILVGMLGGTLARRLARAA